MTLRSAALALLATVTAAPAGAQPAVEEPLDRVLSAVVDGRGRVDYRALRERHRADLDAVLQAVAEQDVAALRSDAQKTAFLVNAYNAHVLSALAARPSARHIERQDLFGDLFRRPVRVAGRSMTLDQLEHGALRRQDVHDGRTTPQPVRSLRPSRVDHRVHAALNCGAVSCPPLQRRAWRARTLDRDLDRAFRAFAGTEHAVRADGRHVVVSSLFDWFAADFESGGRAVGDVLLDAMPADRARAFRARLAGKRAADLRRDRAVAFGYDWTVNRR